MTAAQRERYIAVGTGVLIGLFLINWIFIDPLLKERSTLTETIKKRTAEKDEANRLIAAKSAHEVEYRNLVTDTMKKESNEAYYQLSSAAGQWIQFSRFDVKNNSPETSSEKYKGFSSTGTRITGNGGIRDAARFLYEIQTAKFPVRVTEINITSQPENSDNLQMVVAVSTIFSPGIPAKPGAPLGLAGMTAPSTLPANRTGAADAAAQPGRGGPGSSATRPGFSGFGAGRGAEVPATRPALGMSTTVPSGAVPATRPASALPRTNETTGTPTTMPVPVISPSTRPEVR